MLFEFLILFLTLTLLVLFYFHNSYRYWAKKGVPFIPPKIPFGNTSVLLPKGFTIGLPNKTFYDYFKKRGCKFGGVYLTTEPNLVVVDPDLIKDILCKQFPCFVNRGFYFNEKEDPISANLFTMDGFQWKNLRQKLTPTFTSSKMKMMFKTMVACTDYMLNYVENYSEDFDIREVAGRFTTDVIGSCAFGIECNSFKYPDAEFRVMGKKIFFFNFWRSLRAFFIINSPKLSKYFGLTSNNKDVREFFMKMVKDSLVIRKEKGLRRNDFLQILMDLQDSESLTLDEIAAQVFLFFLAGFETSSSTITFGLYEIAKNPEIQERLRAEISEVLQKHNDQFTYEALGEMTYLAQVVEETLRKWPPGLTLNRRCTQDYNIPETNIVIEKETPLLISTYGIHMDPEFYPEPEKFDPARFTEDQKNNRHPFVYLPFGEGPRNCIGQRFGSLQSRVAIATITKTFKISVSPSTKEVQVDPNRFLMSSVDPILLKLERL